MRKSPLCVDPGPRTHQVPLEKTRRQNFRADFSEGRGEAHTQHLKPVLYVAGDSCAHLEALPSQSLDWEHSLCPQNPLESVGAARPARVAQVTGTAVITGNVGVQAKSRYLRRLPQEKC